MKIAADLYFEREHMKLAADINFIAHSYEDSRQPPLIMGL